MFKERGGGRRMKCESLCDKLEYAPSIVYCNGNCEYRSKNKIPYVYQGKVAGRKYECTKFLGGEVAYELERQGKSSK